MGWPTNVVPIDEKIFADAVELTVQDFIKRYQDIVGIEVTRDQAYRMLRRKSRFKMAQDEKKWWEEIARSGKKILQSYRKNDS
jgi:hypothetical protein